MRGLSHTEKSLHRDKLGDATPPRACAVGLVLSRHAAGQDNCQELIAQGFAQAWHAIQEERDHDVHDPRGQPRQRRRLQGDGGKE